MLDHWVKFWFYKRPVAAKMEPNQVIEETQTFCRNGPRSGFFELGKFSGQIWQLPSLIGPQALGRVELAPHPLGIKQIRTNQTTK